MRIGFTGTQHGMSEIQLVKFQAFIQENRIDIEEFHHGDCIGADAQAHKIVESCGIPIIIHPPIDTSKRAWCVKTTNIQTTILQPRAYLDRNHDIIDSCDILLATPRTRIEELRSGTWATIRYARKQNKEVEILEP